LQRFTHSHWQHSLFLISNQAFIIMHRVGKLT
jgi:hypothetical protein